jgi:hypothetical protein
MKKTLLFLISLCAFPLWAQNLTLTVDSPSLSEGDSGTQVVTFTATLVGAAVPGGFTVDYATADGTATTANSDYIATLGELSFAGDLDESHTFTVTINGDNVVEGDETFTASLSNCSDPLVTLPSSATSVTIQNDDASYSIAATDAVKSEGDSGNTAFTFTVTRLGTPNAVQEIDYEVSGTADATDFGGTLPSGTLTFQTLETQKVITIYVSGDSIVEDNEGFTVTISQSATKGMGRFVNITTATATGTIQNDDESVVSFAYSLPPNLFEAVEEGQLEGDASSLTFTIVLSNPLDASLEIPFHTEDGTATGTPPTKGTGQRHDYESLSGTLTIAAGETQGMIEIELVEDRYFEVDEWFQLILEELNLPDGVQRAIDFQDDLPALAAEGWILNDDYDRFGRHLCGEDL